MHTRKLNEIRSFIDSCQDKAFFLQIIKNTSGPSVSDSDTAHIVDAIKANEKIKHLSLDLHDVKIDAKNIARLIQAVPGDIVLLRFNGIDLNEAGLSNIYNSLKDKHITRLDLEYKMATSLDGYKSLMKILQNNFSGHWLSLNGLNMPPPVITQLSDILKDKEVLNYLEISHNTLGKDIFKVIRHTRARRCFILDCQFQGEEVGSLVNEVIKQNLHLHFLSMGSFKDDAAFLSLRWLFSSELNRSRLVSLQADSKREKLSNLSDFSNEQHFQAGLEREFLETIESSMKNFSEENESELIKKVSELTMAFEALKRNHHKNLDMLSDDYYKFMFEYFLTKNDIEQAVSCLVRIQEKTKRIKGLLDDLFPDLMCAVSTPMTAVEKRQWQFVLLCTLECNDPGFISIQANALSLLITGKKDPVGDAPTYCADILKNEHAQDVLMEMAALKQSCLAREQMIVDVTKLSVNEFWRDCSSAESLNQALLQRVGNLERKLERVDALERKVELLSRMLGGQGFFPASSASALPENATSQFGVFRK